MAQYKNTGEDTENRMTISPRWEATIDRPFDRNDCGDANRQMCT